jgi:hypothetical protein
MWSMSSRGIVVSVVGCLNMVQALMVFRRGRGPITNGMDGCLYSHVAVSCQSRKNQRRTTCSCPGRMRRLYSPGRGFCPIPPQSHRPLNPLLSWPSKIKRRCTLQCHQGGLSLKTPVPSKTTSGVICRERKDSGSPGRRVQGQLSSLPVSHPLTSSADICANPLLISPNVGLNALLVFIPLAWVSHFLEWKHKLTFGCMS